MTEKEPHISAFPNEEHYPHWGEWIKPLIAQGFQLESDLMKPGPIDGPRFEHMLFGLEGEPIVYRDQEKFDEFMLAEKNKPREERPTLDEILSHAMQSNVYTPHILNRDLYTVGSEWLNAIRDGIGSQLTINKYLENNFDDRKLANIVRNTYLIPVRGTLLADVGISIEDAHCGADCSFILHNAHELYDHISHNAISNPDASIEMNEPIDKRIFDPNTYMGSRSVVITLDSTLNVDEKQKETFKADCAITPIGIIINRDIVQKNPDIWHDVVYSINNKTHCALKEWEDLEERRTGIADALIKIASCKHENKMPALRDAQMIARMLKYARRAHQANMNTKK